MKQFHHTMRHASSTGEKPSVRGGFTLVEMMVSIGLVLLIMLMFAAIFEVVAGTMSAQKGIAKNDQKARTLTIIMKEDLEHRTFRQIVPFYPGQKTIPGAHGPSYSAQKRQGYFSISENDPDDPTDDVLAFTARFDVPVSGKATMLDPLLDGGFNNLQNQNQPEFDDGFPPQIINGNQITNRVGVSKTVEIVYFLRHGNLYRRVMLVREPYEDEETDSVQPDELGGDYNGYGSGQFWRDFDYSAYRDYLPVIGITPGPKFHGSDSMSNDSEIPGTVRVDGNGDGSLDTADVLVPPSLGIPFLRFGHSPKLAYGIPREFVGPNNSAPFIGRFTTQETAHSTFGYPGRDVDPHDLQFSFVLNAAGLVSQFGDKTFRRGIDILMTNVHEFDIKVWDDYSEDFNRNGLLDPSEELNTNNLIDEVHRFVDLGYGNLELQTLGANYTPNPVGYYHWASVINTNYSPTNSLDPSNNSTAPPRIRYDTWHPFEDISGSNFGFPPFRPLHPYNGNDRVHGTFQDDDRDGTLDNLSERGWLGSDDEVPLKAIQITVRFFDVESDQIRQLTLIHTLTD